MAGDKTINDIRSIFNSLDRFMKNTNDNIEKLWNELANQHTRIANLERNLRTIGERLNDEKDMKHDYEDLETTECLGIAEDY